MWKRGSVNVLIHKAPFACLNYFYVRQKYGSIANLKIKIDKKKSGQISAKLLNSHDFIIFKVEIMHNDWIK